MIRPRVRVAAYVIRHRDVSELLIFDHVDDSGAGTQIPAGVSAPAKSWKSWKR